MMHTFGSNIQKWVPNHPLSTLQKRENAQGSDLAPFFEDLSQSEKLSEIKPPLQYLNREIEGV